MSSRMTPLEKRAYELILSAGEKGILQSDLWRLLGIDSREGSRIALKLVKKGLIERESVVHNGRKTYRLIVKRAVLPKIDVDDVMDIPCFTCPMYNRCGGGSLLSPASCKLLTEWLLNEVRRRKAKLK